MHEPLHGVALLPARRPTDRAAAFRLEALREMQPAFAARRRALHVQVQRDGARPAVAQSPAARAALVVVDEHYGVEPHASAAAALAATGAPLWLCDCHRPSRRSRCPTPRCAAATPAFLRATAALRAPRLREDWFPPPAPPPPRGGAGAPAPAWSTDLAAAPDAVARALALPSRRDARVAPCAHTRGGARAAAARWRRWLRSGAGRELRRRAQRPAESRTAAARAACPRT